MKMNCGSDVYQPLLRPHMPELDSIRGLAILGVVFYHGLYWAKDMRLYSAWQRLFLSLMSSGQFGVNLFFILSGFLITGILLDSRSRHDFYKRFYFRRALRILPAYYATLLILVLFGLMSRGFLYMSLLYSSNLSLLFGIAMSYPVLWSLAVEEHFYFLWPAAVRNLSPRSLTWVAGFILVLSPICRLSCHLHAEAVHFVDTGCGFYTWNMADGLALGALIAMNMRKPGFKRRHMWAVTIFLFALGLLVSFAGLPFGITTRMSAVGEAFQYVPMNLWFGATLCLFLLIGSGPRKSWVTPRILTFFGEISYGLYLYHMLFFAGYQWLARRTNFESSLGLNPWDRTWTTLLVAGATSIIVAYLSRRYFEGPFLQLKDWLPERRDTSAGAD